MMITQNNNVFDQIADPPCSAVVMGRAEYQLQGNLITLTPMFNRYHRHIHHHHYHFHLAIDIVIIAININDITIKCYRNPHQNCEGRSARKQGGLPKQQHCRIKSKSPGAIAKDHLCIYSKPKKNPRQRFRHQDSDSCKNY